MQHNVRSEVRTADFLLLSSRWPDNGGRVLRAETIRNEHSDLFTFVQGDLESTARICHRPEETCPDSLVYLSNRKQLDAVSDRKSVV